MHQLMIAIMVTTRARARHSRQEARLRELKTPSLRGAKRRSNPGFRALYPGLLRHFAPRKDGVWKCHWAKAQTYYKETPHDQQ